jgi:hypothetical protein
MKKITLAALTLALAPALFADPTSISTGVAPWAVNGNPVFAVDLTQLQLLSTTWIPNFGDGVWIGPSTTSGNYLNTGDGAAPGSYVYTLAIGALMGGSGTFSLKYASDDTVGWSINMGSFTSGVASTTCTTFGTCWSSPTAPITLTGTFSAMSVLTATVVNLGSVWNPSGFLAVGTATLNGNVSPIPEPSTYAMLLLGAAGVAASRLRKGRN